MKFDVTATPGRSAARVLTAFSGALLGLLQQRPLEQLTVYQVCDEADYPRATFYHYFDDLRDLLDYCWHRMSAEVRIDDYADLPDEARTAALFERIYAYFAANRTRLKRIMAVNPADGALTESLGQFMKTQIARLVASCPASEKYELPCELIAEHYGNTIQLVLEWCFLREEPLQRDEALAALRYLLRSTEGVRA